MNFTLITSCGEIDLLGHVTGGGGYEEILPHTVRLTLYGVECLCIDLDLLIKVKRAAGRAKDLEVLAELEILRERGGHRGSPDA